MTDLLPTDAEYYKPSSKFRPMVKYRGKVWPQSSEQNAHEIIAAINTRQPIAVESIDGLEDAIEWQAENFYNRAVMSPKEVEVKSKLLKAARAYLALTKQKEG